MDGYADIHCHLLPGVDDGAGDPGEAMALLRMAYGDGIRTLVLTPHYRGSYKQNSPDMLREIFFRLQSSAAEEMPELRLYLGQEIAYEQAAPETLAEGKALTLGDSDYCLLEFSPNALRSRILGGVAEILRYGYIPILAHAERCSALRKEPSLADELLNMGALIQLNADSVLGRWGWGVGRFCRRLLREGKAQFIATDAHDLQDRPPLLHKCWQKVSKTYGHEYAARLFYENAWAVTENRPVD